MLPNQRTSDKNPRGAFRHGLHLLDGIASWHSWSSAITILLLPGLIGLLSFPFHERDAIPLVCGLLGMIWVASAFTLYRQRRRLKLLRKDLIEQMDAATKNRVRGEQ